jgi:hypothetical protein
MPPTAIVDGYSVMCRSDTAALAMAGKVAENRNGRGLGEYTACCPT